MEVSFAGSAGMATSQRDWLHLAVLIVEGDPPIDVSCTRGELALFSFDGFPDSRWDLDAKLALHLDDELLDLKSRAAHVQRVGAFEDVDVEVPESRVEARDELQIAVTVDVQGDDVLAHKNAFR